MDTCKTKFPLLENIWGMVDPIMRISVISGTFSRFTAKAAELTIAEVKAHGGDITPNQVSQLRQLMYHINAKEGFNDAYSEGI